MIERIIDICLRNRFLVIAAFTFIILWGIFAIRETPIDAIPDIGDLQVIVFADWPGRSPKDVEDQVVYPLTTKLIGIPGVKTVRSSSAFGLGMVNLIFKDGVDYYWARTRVLERLDIASEGLPLDAHVMLGPDATALGQIFWYTVENGYYCLEHPQTSYDRPGVCPIDNKPLKASTYDVSELRSIQDWYVKYQLNAVHGVSEVASVGGFVKQYQIDINPQKLAYYGIAITDVLSAVRESNIDVGAKVFEEGGREFIIRGVGFIKNINDIENISLMSHQGVPVFVRDVGTVTMGPDFRRGALDKEGVEVTGGVVVMRYGENPLKVIKGVKDKIETLSIGLPPGVRIVPFYDRTGLITRTINTLKDALLQETIIVVVILTIFLLHFFSSFIISLVLPVGILIAFIFMRLFGIDANVMSLGGIAIAIGVLDDAGSVLVENIYRRLAERQKNGVLSTAERLKECIKGAQEVGRPIFFALLIAIIGFIPVFALTGQAGKLFRPLAYTKTFAMIGAAFISISLMPVLSYFLIRGRLRLADETIVARFLRNLYRPVMSWSLDHRLFITGVSLLILVVGVVTSTAVKQEFMPPLNEGDLLFMPVLLPGASLSQVMDVMRKQDVIIQQEFPDEVEWVVGKLGHAETATDPSPVTMIETIIHLKPERMWRRGMTRERLMREIQDKTKIPGVSPIMTQPIRNRIDMLATGIQTPVGIKVFGPDYTTIERIATELEGVIGHLQGISSVYAERIGNRPYLEIEIDRTRIARYGISLATVQDIIATAVGGMNLTQTVEGRERYPVRVRYMRDFRESPEALSNIYIPTPEGEQIPLSQLVQFKKTIGPDMIQSENTMPYVRVFINVDQDVIGLVDFVTLAQKTVSKKIAAGELTMPQGTYITWSGQFESEAEARQKLLIVVPLCFAVILFLLYIAFKDARIVALIATALPFSLAGGIIPLYLFGFRFSTAVWVGFIALFGIATDNAVVLLAAAQDLYRQNKPMNKAALQAIIVDAGLLRVRPIMMTTATTILALVPIMFFTSAGSEMIKPMASPIIGGLITATLTNLVLVPALYAWVLERRLPKE